MRDIAVVVEHGTPFLFPDAEDSIRKMKSFVSNGDATVSATAMLFHFACLLSQFILLQHCISLVPSISFFFLSSFSILG